MSVWLSDFGYGFGITIFPRGTNSYYKVWITF